jgi:tetratricopeptide (TPR) repeat protein
MISKVNERLVMNRRSRQVSSAAVALWLVCSSGAVTHGAQQTESAKTVRDVDEGVAHYRAGEFEKAVKSLESALKNDPQRADVLEMLGLSQLALGKLDEARKAFERGIALQPDREMTRRGLAYVFLALGNFTGAETEAMKAVALAPENYEARYLLGLAKLRLEKRADALAQADAALKIKPNYENAVFVKTQSLLGDFYGFYLERKKDPKKPIDPERIAKLRQAQDAVERYLALPVISNRMGWSKQLESIKACINAAEGYEQEKGFLFLDPVQTRPVVTKIVKPKYTEAARRNYTQGKVVFLVLIETSGKIEFAIPVKSLPDGLTDKAFEALEQCEFLPGTRNGRPSSYIGVVEFAFSLL